MSVSKYECMICGKKLLDLSVFQGKRVPVPRVCGSICLEKYLRQAPKRDWRPYLLEKVVKSSIPNSLEMRALEELGKMFRAVVYNRYLFMIPNGTKPLYYLPDIYIPEVDQFIEVKGVRYRLNKAKTASKYLPLHIITVDLMIFWEWVEDGYR